MKLLASAAYDPAVAVSKATTAAIAMTALDTTNLRLTFTVKGRVNPLYGGGNIAATTKVACWSEFIVSGLTPAANLTWDAAYSVETVVAATGLKYGGPNDTTVNNAFGASCFEIWDCTTEGTAGASAADIWAHAARTLTAGTNIALAKGTGVTGFNDIAAADVWAVGTRALTDKAGFSLTQAFPTNFAALAITAGGAVTVGTVGDKAGYSLTTAPLDAAGTRAAVGLTTANLDAQLGTLMTSASYTAPDNAGIAGIKAKTDSLTFTVAGKLDVNVLVINGVTVFGIGTEADKWRGFA